MYCRISRKKLAVPIHGTKRNLTINNSLTSIPLGDKMLANYNSIVVGTPRRKMLKHLSILHA